MKVERERELQFNTAGDFQVRGAAVLNDRLANDVRRNGAHSSGTDDDKKTVAKTTKINYKIHVNKNFSVTVHNIRS